MNWSRNFFFFFGISNKSFIEDEKFFMFAIMNTKYLKKITRRSYRRSKSVLELKNRGKMCKTPCPRANKQGTNQQGWLRDPPNILEHTTILLLPLYPHWRNGKQIWFGTSNKPTKAKDDGKPIRVPPSKKSLIEIQTGNLSRILNFFLFWWQS